MTIQTAYTLCGEEGKEKEGDEEREETNKKKFTHTGVSNFNTEMTACQNLVCWTPVLLKCTSKYSINLINTGINFNKRNLLGKCIQAKSLLGNYKLLPDQNLRMPVKLSCAILYTVSDQRKYTSETPSAPYDTAKQ